MKFDLNTIVIASVSFLLWVFGLGVLYNDRTASMEYTEQELVETREELKNLSVECILKRETNVPYR